jgi:hypothetical protein
MMAAFPRKVLRMNRPTPAPLKPIKLPELKPIGTNSVSKKQSLQEWHAAGGGVPLQYKGREHVWHAKVKKFAEGGEVQMKKGGDPLDEFSPPRYRSAGRRPESQQDRKAAANMPMDFARGVASGVLGAPGDIESLIRMLPGLNERTVLPTSEDIEKRIPLRSDTPAGRAAAGLGTLAGGFYMGPGAPIRLVGGLPQAVYKAGKDFAQAAGRPAANVVKPKGGNWLKGSVEDSLADLKGRTLSPEEMAQAREAIKLSRNPEYTAGASRRLDEYDANLSLNNFIDKKIAPYIRNDMATPDDPLRAMAEKWAVEKPAKLAQVQARIDAFGKKMAQTARERGVPVEELTSMRQQMIGLEKERDLLQAKEALHTYNAEDAMHGDWLPEQVALARMRAGFPTHGVGVSPVARAWENASDNFINVSTAGKHNLPLSPSEVSRGLRSTVDDNPWIAKVPPETPVYYPEGFGMSRNVNDIGFDHLIDELRNATRPTSDLPKNLLIDPADLSKITLPQAVDRVSDINAWRATQKMEADLLKANNEATQLFKDYPDKGMKWVELRQPEPKLPEGAVFEEYNGMQRLFGPDGESLSIGATKEEATKLYKRKEREKQLEDALKYEGDIMKHCVGGYCPDVLEGRSRIYSLRDAKGAPHATVETKQIGMTPEQRRYKVGFLAAQLEKEGKTAEDALRQAEKIYPEESKESIIQIKGKQNRAPNEEYLPYIQDFVKGGKWSDVGDLRNTGLTRKSDLIDKFSPDELDAIGAGEYLTKAEQDELLLRALRPPEDGMAHGGAIHMAGGGAAKKVVEGAVKGVKKLLGVADEAPKGVEPIVVKAAERAAAGKKAAELIKSQPQIKASEALGQAMEKGFKKTTTTQADRTRVGGGNIGGAPFSAISEADPAYAGKVWGVMDEGTAARLKNLTTPDTAWTTMLGSANQLKTNPIVFDKLKKGFLESMKAGNLTPELEAKINHNLALTFGEGAQIRDPNIWKQADTFEKRAALADLMMGQGIPPSKGGVPLGGEKSGKGVIFKPTDILKRETEPGLLHPKHGGNAPTFAAGPRLFSMDPVSEFRPDLHPGFPTMIGGKDLGVNMNPTPTEVYLPEWHRNFKKANPDRKGPGYYDLALGVEGEGLPSQKIDDEYIRHLLREGYKKGGRVGGLTAATES